MEIRLKVGDKEITATLIDSETTRDFISLLPLTLTMNALFRREKFGHLPRAISEGGPRKKTYVVGEVIYWSPGPDVAIFYRHDGQYSLPRHHCHGQDRFGRGSVECPGVRKSDHRAHEVKGDVRELVFQR
jgi:hypothetical protein